MRSASPWASSCARRGRAYRDGLSRERSRPLPSGSRPEDRCVIPDLPRERLHMRRSRSNPVSDLEAAVADLQTRRAALRDQLGKAQAAWEATQRERRSLLMQGADANALAEADQACHRQESREAGL